jgi:hypothetical protein
MGWFTSLVGVGILGLGGLYVYDLNRTGYMSLPDLPSGAYPIAFKNGLRAVVHDMDVTDTQYADTPKLFRRLSLARACGHSGFPTGLNSDSSFQNGGLSERRAVCVDR